MKKIIRMYSLGAEVAGFAGKTLKEWNLSLARITGILLLFYKTAMDPKKKKEFHYFVLRS